MRVTRCCFAALTAIVLFFTWAPSPSRGEEITLVREGNPNSTLVTSETPTAAARLAALELQYHIEKITGALLPIKTASQSVEGNRILVGQSRATKKLGLKSQDFPPQEYLIRFLPETVILMGKDWLDTPENRKDVGYATYDFTLAQSRHKVNYFKATGRKPQSDAENEIIELPGLYDDQGTCYATYDFLERFCDVRWYGPAVINVVFPQRRNLTVGGSDVRRAPAMTYRTDGVGQSDFGLWGGANDDQMRLFSRRLRVGGERWAGNHSFYSYYERFMEKSDQHPEWFEEKRPEFFSKGYQDKTQQLCYTNEALIQQAAQDARDFFDGKGYVGIQPSLGDYFSVVPMDHHRWCLCDNCQAMLALDADKDWDGFSTGTASHYFFNFVNAVAKEVRKTHPDKFISTLAYASYCYLPEDIQLETNVSMAPCLHPRNYWNTQLKQNDIAFYKKWVEKRDRPIYLWNYYCFPNMMASRGFRVFPGFCARHLADQIKMYHADGVRGVFLCGIGEQVDYYLSQKLYDDPAIDPDQLLDEFFSRYFGAAAIPMQKFFNRIEEIYNDPQNYVGAAPEENMHQTEEIAWGRLGTEERMNELGGLIDLAERYAVADAEKQRVALWKDGVWKHMVEGRKAYLAKKKETAAGS